MILAEMKGRAKATACTSRGSPRCVRRQPMAAVPVRMQKGVNTTKNNITLILTILLIIELSRGVGTCCADQTDPSRILDEFEDDEGIKGIPWLFEDRVESA